MNNKNVSALESRKAKSRVLVHSVPHSGHRAFWYPHMKKGVEGSLRSGSLTPTGREFLRGQDFNIIGDSPWWWQCTCL